MEELREQTTDLPRRAIALNALRRPWRNRLRPGPRTRRSRSPMTYAPEHLALVVEKRGQQRIGDVRNAGGLFVGEASPEALGDYVAGPSHVIADRRVGAVRIGAQCRRVHGRSPPSCRSATRCSMKSPPTPRVDRPTPRHLDAQRPLARTPSARPMTSQRPQVRPHLAQTAGLRTRGAARRARSTGRTPTRGLPQARRERESLRRCTLEGQGRR